MSEANDFLLPEDLPPDHRSGFVTLAGKPNVGKSTLVNRLLGQKIAIVSPKPQTTRNRLMGILTTDQAQIIFLDTPGIHAPLHRLGEYMVDAATQSIADADLVLWVVDVSMRPTEEDRRVAALLLEVDPATPVILAMNKSDHLRPQDVQSHTEAYAALLPRANWMLVSAVRGDNLDKLLEMMVAALPRGPRFYPPDQVTDQQERFIAGELVREQVLNHLREEVPHAIAVAVDEFKERSEEMTYISAVIYVERDTQKAIVLGRDGQMLKSIGQAARQSIETLLDTRVFLDLWVKVRPKWRTKDTELRRLGYNMPKEERSKGRKR